MNNTCIALMLSPESALYSKKDNKYMLRLTGYFYKEKIKYYVVIFLHNTKDTLEKIHKALKMLKINKSAQVYAETTTISVNNNTLQVTINTTIAPYIDILAFSS